MLRLSLHHGVILFEPRSQFVLADPVAFELVLVLVRHGLAVLPVERERPHVGSVLLVPLCLWQIKQVGLVSL